MIERRFNSNAQVRTVRTDGANDGAAKIAGYAAVFNEEFVLYEDEEYRVREIIAPGAFSDVLAGCGKTRVRLIMLSRFGDYVTKGRVLVASAAA